MGKKIEIKCISYVHVGDQLVRFDELPKQQREDAAQTLMCRYMNELYRGQAVFTPCGMEEKILRSQAPSE